MRRARLIKLCSRHDISGPEWYGATKRVTGASLNGTRRRRTLLAARRKISLGAESPMGKRGPSNGVVAVKPKRTMSAASRRKIAAFSAGEAGEGATTEEGCVGQRER